MFYLSIQIDQKKESVMIRQGKHLATTFHPEMHGDTLIHEYFLNMAGILG